MNPLKRLLTVMNARFHRRLVADNLIAREMASITALFASLLPLAPKKWRLQVRLSALRLASTRSVKTLAGGFLRPWLTFPRSKVWKTNRIGWQRYARADFGNIFNDSILKTSLLLKAPGPNGEKGVLYSSFEYNWMKIIASSHAREILSQYFLVGASSWSPTDYAVFTSLIGLSRDPVFVGISNLVDVQAYEYFRPTISPVSIMACDWIDPSYYKPLSHADRQIDILMVAHWECWKRHWILFQALSRMKRSLNVVLIGRESGERTTQKIFEEAKAFGVAQNLTLLTNIPIEDVIAHQCNAKITIACSKREGSCVSVTEAMFANSPVAMVDDAHIGSKAYINHETGMLFPQQHAYLHLSGMLERSAAYSARSWAERNISAHQTSRKLNDILQRHCGATHQPWTRDIAGLCWHYVPKYLRKEDEGILRSAVEDFNERYPVKFSLRS